MEIKTVRTLALEIFKTSNNLNPHRIVLTESTIFLYTVEMHQIMVIAASELLDHTHGISYQKIISPPLL